MNQPLAETIFWIAVAACVVAEIAILRSILVVRGANKSELVPAASRRGELVWAIVPAIVLGVALVVTWQRVEARQMDHSRMNHAMPMASASAATRAEQR
jgi:heme/copper-type cytochrome/quinol oxidase subunit 2